MPRKRKATPTALAPDDLFPGLVDPPADFADGYRETRWCNPVALRDHFHPDNAHTHPPEQQEAIRDSLTQFGWVVPLVYNLATGRLLDGHGRLPVAIDMGFDRVPVAFGSWSESQEPGLLATFDAITLQAGYDQDRYQALRDRLDGLPPSLLALAERVATDPAILRGLAAAKAIPARQPPSPPAAPAVRHVEFDARVGGNDAGSITLTFTPADFARFQAAVAVVAERFRAADAAEAVFLGITFLADEPPDDPEGT